MRTTVTRGLLGADEVACNAIRIEPEAESWAEEARSTAELRSAIRRARRALGSDYGGPANAVVIDADADMPGWVIAAAALASAAEVEHRQPAIFLTEKGGAHA